MKRTLALIVLLASGMVLSASAQTPAAAAPAGPAKVAVIAFQMAVAKTNEGQRDFADLMKKFEPRRAKLKAQNDELEGLSKQLQAQGDKLAPAEQQSRAATIESKKKQLDRDAEDAQNDLQQEEQQLYATLASKVYDVLQGYVEKQGFTIVLDVTQTQQQAQQVLYAAPSTNITEAVVDAYNAKSGVPAPPTADAPKPAPAHRPAAK